MKRKLYVGGVVSITTVDYPGHIASVIFFQGCPWRCVYCHNTHLQKISPTESLPWEDVIALLKTRRGFVEAVVFSGGEPLVQEGLLDAMQEVKDLGFLIGLHTSGANSKHLPEIIKLVDWVGFDIKNGFHDYKDITNIDNSGVKARESLKIVLDSNVDLEIRVTMFKSIDTSTIVETLKELSSMGVKKVALQKCRDKNENIIEHQIFSDKLLLEDLSRYFDEFLIR